MAEEKNISQSVDPEARALVERYPKVYSERKFWRKLWRWAKRAGRVVIQHALTLYYCAQDRDTPGGCAPSSGARWATSFGRWIRTRMCSRAGIWMTLGFSCSCSVTSLNTSNPSTTTERVSA